MAQFNRQGIDGLIERPRPGRTSKINAEQTAYYRELIEKPELAEQTHWTGVKFHGYLRQELQHEVGYRTVIRWLHDNNFRLKVPQSWPGRQNEEQRQAFLETLKPLLNDPEVDIRRSWTNRVSRVIPDLDAAGPRREKKSVSLTMGNTCA